MIGHMIKKEFRQLRRDKRMFPMIFFSPVFQLLLLGLAANLDPQNISLLICDLDRSPQSLELSREIVASEYFIPVGTLYDLNDVAPEMEKRHASATMVIPRGFGADLTAGRYPQIPYIADGSDSTTAAIASAYAGNIVRRFGLKYLDASVPPPVRLDVRSRIFFNSALESRDFMVPGLLALVLLVITLILTSLAVVKEKEMGTMEQLIVTPLRTSDIIYGKLIPFAMIGVLDILLIMAASRLIFGLEIAGSFLLLFSFSLLFLFNTLGLGLLVSTFSNNQQQAMMASVLFVMLPMIILSGFVFPVDNMPPPIRIFTYLLPMRYYLTVVRGIYLKGAGLRELWDEGLAMLILGMIIISISLLRFRKRLE
jgi:ABC-2 type transport system permease protein